MRQERQRFVIGNWKLNGSLAENGSLLTDIVKGYAPKRAGSMAVCVPYPYLAQTRALLEQTQVGWGAQDVSEHDRGAFTGEVSGAMLKEFGVRFVLVGHSERRALFGETDAVVAAKTAAALRSGLMPVVCVGETLAEREAGDTQVVVSRQMDAVLDSVGADGIARSIVAYEPVWAIGTGKTATNEQADEVHALIRERIARKSLDVAKRVSVLYGGSVKPDNAVGLFAMPNVDGGLIGGASLKAADFLSIWRALPV